MSDEAILTFQAITEARDEAVAIEYLSKNDWDVVVSVRKAAANEFFASQTQGRRVAPTEEAQRPIEEVKRPQEEEKKQPQQAPNPREQRGWLRRTWDGIARVGSEAAGLVTGVFSSLTECHSSTTWSREQESPLSDAVVRLLHTVSVPTRTLTIETHGYRRASLHASMEKRPLLVFLHQSDFLPAQLREVFFSDAIVSVLREHFIVLVLDERNPDYFTLIGEVTRGDLPGLEAPRPVFVAVFMINRAQQVILGSLVTVTQPAEVTEAEVIDFLERSIAQADYIAQDLEDDADFRPHDEERILQDRLYVPCSLRQEQETAFREAEMIASQREEELKAAARQREEEERQRQAKEEELARLKAEKLVALGPEPPENSVDSTQIAFRMPDGGKLNRRFLRSAPVESLYTYIDSLPTSPLGYEIATSFPSHPLSDRSKTLEQEGLAPRALLHVRET